MTNPAADGGKGIFFFDQPEGFSEFPPGHEGHVPLDTDVGRAFHLAGGGPFFRNGKDAGDGLGIFLKDCLSFPEALIIFIGHRNGADIDAIATGRAFGGINITGTFSNKDSEVTFRAIDLFHLGTGDEVDVKMPADLDQFWRDDSHGTVVGGESLVKLRHHPANGRGSFQEMNRVTGISQIQGGLHPGNAPSYYEDGSDLLFTHETLLFRI